MGELSRVRVGSEVSGDLYFLWKRTAVVLEGENLRPLSRPQREILASASWAMKTRVVGSGPEIRMVPSSAKPIMRTFDLSKSLSRLSKAKFQATGLKTPPWGVS